MAKYLVLICGDEQKWAETTPEWGQKNAEGHRAFAAAAGAAVIGGHELEPAEASAPFSGVEIRTILA
jgi:hypothetical protein